MIYSNIALKSLFNTERSKEHNIRTTTAIRQDEEEEKVAVGIGIFLVK